MKAVKENKVYTVDEVSKAEYLAQGFDIVDDDGNVIETSAKKTVPYTVYENVVAENKKLKAENSKLKKG